MYHTLFYERAFFAKVRYHNSPFKEASNFSEEKIQDLDPDVIYLSSASYETSRKILSLDLDIPIVLDIEDSALFHRNFRPPSVSRERIGKERILISHPKVSTVLWGSDPERDLASTHYRDISPRKPFITMYPFVAKHTLPNTVKEKTDEFSVVYLGSIWTGSDYRNYFPAIEKICETGVKLTVYLLNSWSRHNFKIASNLAKKHPNFDVEEFVPYDKAKEQISKYHVGLSGNFFGFVKTKATFGMKPLEYAYAGVQPSSLGHPIKNLSDGKEFGYCCTPETIVENFEHNLDHFDWDYHLMDNHLEEMNIRIHDGFKEPSFIKQERR